MMSLDGSGAAWPAGDRRFPEAGIDFDRANAARIYDYLLGGAHNFAVDREQAATILAAQPDMVRICEANRAFLARAVTWCLDAGIGQFLDLGCGVPTVGNVHEIAHRAAPDVRVAYVDFEPVAVAHAEQITAELATVTVTAADLRDPDTVLTAPGVAGLLDFTAPIALLAVAVLHFIPDDLDPIFARYRDALAPGSALVISHGSDDWPDPDLAAHSRKAASGYRTSATPVTLRSRNQLAALTGDWALVAPEHADITTWTAPPPSPGSSVAATVSAPSPRTTTEARDSVAPAATYAVVARRP